MVVSFSDEAGRKNHHVGLQEGREIARDGGLSARGGVRREGASWNLETVEVVLSLLLDLKNKFSSTCIVVNQI